MDLNIELDLHNHTIMSGHAYSTLQEMVAEASRRGLKYLGISEHGPTVPGSCRPIYFRNYHVIPRTQQGVRLLMGAELNILDYNGSLDLPDDAMSRLDYASAGLHSVCYTPGNATQNTDALLGAMHHPRIGIITHPADGTGPVHLEELVKASRDTGTLLELNNSSLNPARNRHSAKELNLEMLRICRRMQVPVILGSDAHISYSIATYDHLIPLLQQTDFPDELIINSSFDRLTRYWHK